MKKLIFLIIFPFLLFAESIESYQIKIEILQSGSLKIKENILYNFGDSPHHGIYRDIPYLMKTDFIPKEIGLKNFIILMDDREVKWEKIYHTSGNYRVLRLKIGDPNTFIKGKHLYTISYEIEKGVLYFDDMRDTIRYNAVGNGWRVSINNIQIETIFPPSLSKYNTTFKVFKGYYGSKDTIPFKWINERKILINIPHLNPHEGVTIEAIFPRGLLEQSGKANQTLSFFEYLSIYFQYPLALIFLIFIYREYKKHSFSLKKSIAVMYEPPKNMDVLQAGLIYDKFADTEDFPAAVVELAQKGYLEIFPNEKKSIFNSDPIVATFKKTDKDPKDLSEDERYLLEYILFRNGSDTFILQKNDPSTSQRIIEGFSKINQMLYDWAVREGYFKENPKKTRKSFLIKSIIFVALSLLVISLFLFKVIGSDMLISSIFVSIFVAVGAFITFSSKDTSGKIFGLAFTAMSLFILSQAFSNNWKYILLTPVPFIIISITTIALVYRNIGELTPKGYDAYLKLKGLKEFIKRVKEDEIKRRLKEDPAFLDKLLPYAILFKETKHWIKLYDLAQASYPYWYHGDFGTFDDIGYRMGALAAPISSSSDSIGGGGSFSGGGIGGGGGGSW